MISLRTKIEGVAALVLAILAITAFSFYTKYQEEKQQKQGVEQLFSKAQDSVTIYKNVHGRLVSRNNAVVLENQTIKQLVKDGNLSFLKEFQDLKRSYKNLEYAFQAQSKSIDSIKIHLHDSVVTYIDKQGDTVKFQAKSWKKDDKWAKFQYKELSPDSAIFKYEVDVPIDGVLYWKRKWFLGKKKYFSEMSSSNPHVTIPKVLELKVGKK